MQQFIVEGRYIPKSQLKKARQIEKADLAEPFVYSYWAASSEEAVRLAEADLQGGQWLESPKVSSRIEDQQMRAKGMPELAGLGPLKVQKRKSRPVSTYSIAARDPLTGEMGVAVQSHWFSVGPLVPWAEAGVGAAATQAFVQVSYGPEGLELMRSGTSAEEALQILLSKDEQAEVRQVGMVDALGRAAAHTGKRVIPAAGHLLGDQFTVQANLMENESVWPAMAHAFEKATGDLSERMLQALEAAELAGGDIRGRQSAAILVVAGESTGKPWQDRIVDLRVEDHPEPVRELRRLVSLQRLYRKLNDGDEVLALGDIDQAVARYAEALLMAPDTATNGEAAFWTGISLASAGQIESAIPYLARAQKVHEKWSDLVDRLPAAGLLPDDPELLNKLKQNMV